VKEVAARDLSRTISRARIVLCTGAGGVGKTTTAAALALASARSGRRTVVVTIDPARRLAQALGLDRLEDAPQPVAGVEGLDAMMLDMKRTFDGLIDRYAGSPARAERIKANRFYQQLSDSLAGTQEYMATEKLYDLHQTGGWDCIVVDTPPTRNALDFLDAPRRLTDFLEGRFLRLFLAPGMAAGRVTARAAGFGAGLFLRAMGRITGATVLADLAEFFQSFEGMYDGFKRRAQAVYDLLKSPGAAFVVVASPETPALREARFFLERLATEGMPTAGLVVNRMTPDPSSALGGHAPTEYRAAAERLEEGVPEQAAAAALLRLAADRADDVAREQRTIASVLQGVDPGALVEVPRADDDLTDLDGLTWLTTHLAAA
jgi:anion-transporting  ArsA/GET3 family ATPase